ncbi:MAG: hypothetical protein J7K98_00460 [Candidatus Aenigmarchaeota archaeon]|nr:hypothetical protein [Candidatus Aenigmarchaeota archaeon]
MRPTKVMVIGLIVIFIAAFTIIYIIDNIGKAMKRCETDKTLKLCRTNTIAIVTIILLIMVAGLVIIIATVAYIMLSAETGGVSGGSEWM